MSAGTVGCVATGVGRVGAGARGLDGMSLVTVYPDASSRNSGV